ncbi:guanylate kinase-like [Mytilus californianus]|uniref:guanylate kinase-like n=1 Tax=Mytilus californianus TaxID=6549 RepID=UPI0022477DB6|nr:guanylate kinase-like [Mytilus californianus]
MFNVLCRRSVSSGFYRFVRVSLRVCHYSTFDMTSFRPIVISGPSGGGKSTLLTRLFKEFPDCFAFSVSHTTRNPRAGEQDGKDYFFVTRPDFEAMIAENGFLEHAEFSGNRYGTSKKAVEDIQKTGRICILDVEVNGVKNIKKTDFNARYVFVRPPSMEVLVERLKSRGTETEESLQKRINSAKESLEYAEQKGSYDHIVVNDDLNKAYDNFRGLLIEDITALQQARLKATK